MAVILVLSTGAFSGEQTGGALEPLLRWLLPSLTAAHIDLVHAIIRKAGHLAVYGILAGLWRRALVRERALAVPAASWAAFAISVAWACVDELHQSTVPSRGGSAMDVVIDAAGAAVVLLASSSLRKNAQGDQKCPDPRRRGGRD